MSPNLAWRCNDVRGVPSLEQAEPVKPARWENARSAYRNLSLSHCSLICAVLLSFALCCLPVRSPLCVVSASFDQCIMYNLDAIALTYSYYMATIDLNSVNYRTDGDTMNTKKERTWCFPRGQRRPTYTIHVHTVCVCRVSRLLFDNTQNCW